MGTSSSRLIKGSTTQPDVVPFIGWSKAAEEFRTRAAELAPGGAVRPLIIGDPGIGKRTMARAWQFVAGSTARMCIEDLEERSLTLPKRCIGVSVCRPPRGRYCFLLGSGVGGDAPEPGPGAIRLDDETMQWFELSMYMPPVHPDRPIDVLAFLDYWDRARCPRVGIRYSGIESALLHRMLFGTGWPANLDSIYRLLRILNHLNRPSPPEDLEDEAESSDGEELEGPVRLPIVLDVLRDRRDAGSDSSPATSTADQAIPFAILPDVAVRIYLWHCQHQPLEEAVRESPEEGSGREPIPASLRPFVVGLAARDFINLTEEQFVREHILPGLPASMARRSDCVAILMDRVRNHRLFGTDFRSLQAGLRIDPNLVELAVGRRGSDPRGVVEGAVATWGLQGQGSLSSFSRADGEDRVNSFCSRGSIFSISFRPAVGPIEEDQFPQSGNSGMAYYRYLLMHPDRVFSPEEIENANGRKGTARDRPDQQDAEWDDSLNGSGFDAVLDESSKRQAAERLAEIARELARAEREGDRSRIAQLEVEREKLIACYKQAVRNPRDKRLEQLHQRLKDVHREIAIAERDGDHLVMEELETERQSLLTQVSRIVQSGRDRNLDSSKKQARDRVRKALEDARKKLALGRFPQLARYLVCAVQYKNGNWTYRSSKSSPTWQT